jgi:hypothetical protein
MPEIEAEYMTLLLFAELRAGAFFFLKTAVFAITTIARLVFICLP